MIEDVRGAAFPFRIDPETGAVAWASGHKKIRQNIRIILGTRHGERPMLRQFGSRVHSLVHDVNDDVLADLVQRQAQQALLQWEPRVLIIDSQVDQSEGELRLRLRYRHTTEPVADEVVLAVQ